MICFLRGMCSRVHPLTLLILAAVILPNGRRLPAQEIPSATFPWNDIQAVETIALAEPFVSIIPGGNPVDGSNTQTTPSSRTMLEVELPFRFRFLTRWYEQGTKVKVGISGVMAFEDVTQSGMQIGSYNLTPDFGGPYSRLLMPFWGNLVALAGSNSNTGIWHATTTSSPRVLIVEWMVGSADASALPVNFQVRLYEDSNKIEFWYNTSTATLWPTPDAAHAYGAVIGIKKYGQPCPLTEWPECDPTNSDNCYALLMRQWNAASTVPFATRLTINNGTAESDVFGAWSSNALFEAQSQSKIATSVPTTASNYFHYKVPDGIRGFRIKPVQTEIDPDTLVFNSANACNIYEPKQQVDVRMVVRNNGTDSAFDVVASLAVFRGYDTVELGRSLPRHIPAIAPNASVEEVFPSILPPLYDSTPGHYVVRAETRVVPKGQPVQVRRRFADLYISADTDMKALCIAEPRLVMGDRPKFYAVGDQIPITGVFLNAGNHLLNNVPVRYEVRTDCGNPATTIASGNNAITVIEPMGKETVPFAMWVPTAPGLYYVNVYTTVPGDGIRFNDSLLSYPINFAQRTLTQRAPCIPIRVLQPVDLAIGAPASYPHQPGATATLGQPTPVSATLYNNGAHDAVNAVINLRITRGASVVYTASDTVRELPGGMSWTIAQCAAQFTPSQSGAYTVRATVHYPGDVNAANDTAVWVCTVPAIGNTGSHEGTVTAIAEPIPAQLRVRIRFDRPSDAEIRVDLLAANGRILRTLHKGRVKTQMELNVRTEKLPAGTYDVRVTGPDGTTTTTFTVDALHRPIAITPPHTADGARGTR